MKAFRFSGLRFAPLGAMLLLAACGGGGSGGSSGQSAGTPTPVPTPTPSTPPPAPAGANFAVLTCLQQKVTPDKTLFDLVVPDTVTINLAQASGFPNGRRLEDPVIDLTLAALFLDLTKQPVTTLANLPLNPAANDVPFRSEFPYLAPPQGNPPLSLTAGTTYNFRTDPATSYVRVDRMGMPAVATAVISSSHKTDYNDSNPSDDASLKFTSDIESTLTGLTNALSDDFAAAGLSMCAVPKG
jgi:hypothetical protein